MCSAHQETPIPTTTSIPKSVSTTISQPFTQSQSVSEASASVHEVNVATTTAVSTVSTVTTATTESSTLSLEAAPNAASKLVNLAIKLMFKVGSKNTRINEKSF